MYAEYFAQCLTHMYLVVHKWKLVVFSFLDILATILTFGVLSYILEDLEM